MPMNLFPIESLHITIALLESHVRFKKFHRDMIEAFLDMLLRVGSKMGQGVDYKGLGID